MKFLDSWLLQYLWHINPAFQLCALNLLQRKMGKYWRNSITHFEECESIYTGTDNSNKCLKRWQTWFAQNNGQKPTSLWRCWRNSKNTWFGDKLGHMEDKVSSLECFCFFWINIVHFAKLSDGINQVFCHACLKDWKSLRRSGALWHNTGTLQIPSCLSGKGWENLTFEYVSWNIRILGFSFF